MENVSYRSSCTHTAILCENISNWGCFAKFIPHGGDSIDKMLFHECHREERSDETIS